MRCRLALVAAPILVIVAPALAQVTINVPADQPTIQDGINAAANGDTVLVAPGTYNEIIDFNGKAITVTSSGGAAVTTIDASGVPDPGDGLPVVRIDNGEGPDSVLEGFTVTAGTGDSAAFGIITGGGVFISNASPTIRACVFTLNTADAGGGLIADGMSPLIEDCVFIGNDSTQFGGAIQTVNDASPTIVRCRFEANSAVVQGGAIDLLGGGLTLDRCDFVGNFTTQGQNDRGGAISSETNQGMLVTNCRFFGNSVSELFDGVPNGGQGGAVRMAGDGEVVFINCLFSGNRASDGGAVHGIQTPSTTFANCVFGGNSVSQSEPAGIANAGNLATITNSIFWGNTNSDGSDVQISNNPIVRYSIVQGGFGGLGNLDADPLFVDADGADNVVGTDDDDLRLTAGSPAIDSADYDAYVSAGGPITDLDANERTFDDPGTINTGVGALAFLDRGPFEFLAGPPTLITQHPESILGDIGGLPVVFTVEAPTATTFQWFLGGAPLSDSPPYSGTQSAMLVVSGYDGSAEGLYTCEVSDGLTSELSRKAGLVILPGACLADVTTTGGGAPGVPDGQVDLADLLFFVNEWNATLGVCP